MSSRPLESTLDLLKQASASVHRQHQLGCLDRKCAPFIQMCMNDMEFLVFFSYEFDYCKSATKQMCSHWSSAHEQRILGTLAEPHRGKVQAATGGALPSHLCTHTLLLQGCTCTPWLARISASKLVPTLPW